MKVTDVLKTINILSLACLAGYFIFHTEWLLIVSALLLLLNIIGGKVPFFIAKCWMKLGSFIGSFNSKILLTLVFYLILTPIAGIYRIFNKDLVNHFNSKGKNSYYKDINVTYKKESFENLW